MTLNSDTKFEGKLILGSKNDMMNLVNFNASNGKSKNLHFDMIFLSIVYKVSVKKAQKNSLMTMKSDSNFEEKPTLRNLVNFNASSGKSKNLHFDGQYF